MLSTLPTAKTKTKKQYRGVTRVTRVIQKLAFWVPLIIMIAMIILAIFANFIAPHDPNLPKITDRYTPPVFMEGGKSEYLLGTDQIGRDILSRLIYGARVSLSVSLLVILITAAIGTMLGIAAGYSGGRADAIIMRVVDMALSFPGL